MNELPAGQSSSALSVRFAAELTRAGGTPFVARSLAEAQAYVLRIAGKDGVRVVAVTSERLVKELITNEIANEKGLELVYADGKAPDVLSRLKLAELGISAADAGIAESGTIVLCTRNDADRLVTALPRIHIAVLKSSNLVQSLGKAAGITAEFIKLTQGSGVVSLITGPSSTADIGGLHVIGVHGPRQFHVIILE